MNTEKLITTRTAAIARSKLPQGGIAKKAKCSQSYVSKYAHAQRVPDYAHRAIEKVLRIKTAIVPPVSYAERMKKRAASVASKKTVTRRVAKAAAPKTNGTHVPMKAIVDDTPSSVLEVASRVSKLLGEYEVAIRADERAKIRARFETHLSSASS